MALLHWFMSVVLAASAAGPETAAAKAVGSERVLCEYRPIEQVLDELGILGGVPGGEGSSEEVHEPRRARVSGMELPVGAILPPLKRADVFLFEDTEGILANGIASGSERLALYVDAMNALIGTHGDHFEFANILTSYAIETPAPVTFSHGGVANFVEGIGRSILDARPSLGLLSQTLLGYNLFWQVDGGFFNANTVFSRQVICHEYGHQWLVSLPPLLDGRVLRSGDGLCSSGGSHWSGHVDQQGSAMSPWIDWVGSSPALIETTGGEFHRDVPNGFYSYVELYVMGYVSPAEMDAGASELRFMDEGCGSPYNGPISTFTAQNIIDSAGPRVPDSANSQKDYRSGWILFHLPGQSPTDQQFDIALTMMQQLTVDWQASTLGRGTMDNSIPRDCNSNGIHDTCDTDCGPPGGPCDVPGCGQSPDCDGDGAPNECDPDCNGNSFPDSCDVVNGTSSDCNGNGVPDECDTDCNINGAPDACDIAAGTSTDCNGNAVPDECEVLLDCNGNGEQDACDIAVGTSPDCNGNAVPDECDVSEGTSPDCNGNAIPDECDVIGGVSPDCNGNAVPDECDLIAGGSPDCNANAIPDECDLTTGTSLDCEGNDIPDECEALFDCNGNGERDACDIAGGTSADCNGNAVPDECDLGTGDSLDCDGNGIPDECDGLIDCNCNGVPDQTDLSTGTSSDCNGNAVPDECDLPGTFTAFTSPQLLPIDRFTPQSYSIASAPTASSDVTLSFSAVSDLDAPFEFIDVDINGTPVGTVFVAGGNQCPPGPDTGQLIVPGGTYNTAVAGGDATINMVPSSTVDALCLDSFITVTVEYIKPGEDCDSNGVPDECDPDCNGNTISDSCDVFDGASPDCNANGVPDECDLAMSLSQDCDGNDVADACQLAAGTVADCNGNNMPDACDLALGSSLDCDADGILDECEIDCNANGVADDCDIAAGTSSDNDGNGIPDECLVFVDENAQGANNGSSWTDAYTSLQDALARANDPVEVVSEIWVAAGTHRPDGGTGDRTATFLLLDGVRVYGGFSGGETQRDQRAPSVNLTVLTGDLLGDDEPGGGPAGTSENSYHVVTTLDAGKTTELDGFSIERGNANAFCCVNDRGAGLLMSGGAATIRDCKFALHAAVSGAGMHIGEGATPALVRCSFSNNTAVAAGGALFVTGASNPRLTGCVLAANTAGSNAGAIRTDQGSGTVLVNCAVRGNSAAFFGAISAAGGADLLLSHCSLSGNAANNGTGGIQSATNGIVTLHNCIIWGNTLAGTMDQSAQLGGANFVVESSCIQGWTGALGGAGNIGQDPQFADTELRVGSTSPCVDAGDNALHPPDDDDLDADGNAVELLPYDFDGNLRRTNGVVDMGAFELPAECMYMCGDIDGNATVDLVDFAGFALCFGREAIGSNDCACADLDLNAQINLTDFATLAVLFGKNPKFFPPDCL